jgi:hypothetical protein
VAKVGKKKDDTVPYTNKTEKRMWRDFDIFWHADVLGFFPLRFVFDCTTVEQRR